MTSQLSKLPLKSSSSRSALSGSTGDLSKTSPKSGSYSQLNAVTHHTSTSAERLDSQTPKSENVLVSVRVRPLSISEISSGHHEVWTAKAGTLGNIALDDTWKERLRKSQTVTSFQFDQVFTGSDNEFVYVSSASDLVRSAMDGLNVTVFAYGQTSSGKTFTMMGEDLNPGVVPFCVEDVFDYIAETRDKREFLLRVSYLEIYNESINDLLSPENSDIRIREDKHRGIYVSPLKEEIVTRPDQVLDIIRRGERNRHVSATDYNERSSRSHTIFQFIIESRERIPGSPAMTASRIRPPTVPVRISCLNLIDLAGSEKVNSVVDRRIEGSYINKSLLTLGTVISKLAEENSAHIPYRDSKLTRILQPSLQGNARVSVVCTISPSVNNIEESLNTLKFAQRIKKVVTKARANEIMDDKALLQKYKFEIDDLKTQLSLLSTDQRTDTSQLELEKQMLQEELHQQQLVRTALKERIDHLTKLILTSSSFNPALLSTSWPDDSKAKSDSARAPVKKGLAAGGGPLSPTDTAKIFEELAELRQLTKDQKQELSNLKNNIAEKNAKITALENHLNELKSSSSHEPSHAELKTELEEMHHLNNLLEQDLIESKSEIEKLLSSTRNEERIHDLEETIRKYQIQLAEKNHDIVHMRQHLPSNFISRSNSKASIESDGSQSSNAKLLLNLLQTNEHQSKPSSASYIKHAYYMEVDELRKELENERKLREDFETQANEKITQLETELTITKAELSVSEILTDSRAQSASHSAKTSPSMKAGSTKPINRDVK